MHPPMSKIGFLAAVLAAVLVPITAANATTLTTVKYESSVDVQKTNFDKFVTIPKFNPNLGKLQSVFLQLESKVEGSIRLENTDAKSANVTANLAAEVSLLKPDNSILLTTLPTASITKQFAADDAVFDFSGTSGATFDKLSNTQTASTNLTDRFDLFVGLGELTLPVTAIAKSNGSGAGNLAQIFNTFAGASVEVVYEYVAIKPEPAKRKVPESQIPVGAIVAVGFCTLLKSKYPRHV
jgi:hypothetical protein